MPRRAARAADRAGCASARRPTRAVQRRRASAPTRWRARGEEVELPEREVDGARASSSSGATASARRSRSSAARAPTCARWSPTSATPTAWSCGARAIGPFDVADAGALRRRSTTRSASCPRVELGGRRRAAGRPRRGGTAAGAPPAAGTVRLLDADGPDRARRAPRGRHAQARRRLPRLMKVTWLPDAEPRPRRVAVGEFDGVHLGHREVIARRRHRPDVRAAPARGRRARHGAAAAHDARAQGRADRRARRRGARRDPVRRRVRRRSRRRSSSTTCSSATLGAERVSVGENFRFGHRAQGDAALLRAAGRASRRASSTLRRGRRRGRLLEPHPRPGRRRATSSAPTRCLGAPFQLARRRSRTATSAGARSASRPPTSSPTRRSSTPATASTPAARRSSSTASGAGGRRRPTSACARRS